MLCGVAAAQEYRAGWWRGQPVTFKVVDGMAIAEGDIILGAAGEIPTSEPESEKGRNESIVLQSDRFLWPDGVVAYEIDPSLPDRRRVTDAIEHWRTNTPIRFVQRTNERAYVRFVPRNGACSSFVGMIGREQAINLGEQCDTGAVIHEIGHAVGLFHEQSRHDREFYIRVLRENIDKRDLSQFEQALTDGRDAGVYDYSSIMHYDVMAFSRNGRPAIETVPAGIPISQREVLSAGDIDAVKRLYGRAVDETTITTFPFGLEIEVDGERFRAPRTFRWAPGSVHTVNAPGPQLSGSFRHLFARWSDEGGQTHTIVASADTTVYVANFVRQYRMPLEVAPLNAGRLEITPAPEDGWLPVGAEVEIRAIPNGSYRFRGWTGRGLFGTHGISPNPLRVAVRSEYQYTANFTTAPVTMITSEPAGLRVTVDGETFTTPRGFAWAPGSTHSVAVATSEQKTGNETARHTFTGWSDGGAASHPVTAGAGDVAYVARFRTEYNVSLSPSVYGSVALSAPNNDDFYEAGTVLQLSPAPRDGFRFLGWTGDLSGSDSPGLLVVDDQKAVSASFGAPRQLIGGSIVNAADFLFAGGIAPLSLVSIFSPEIGAPGSVRVMFDEVQGVVTAVAPDQVNVAVPAAIAGRTAVQVRVIASGWATNTRIYTVLASNPAVFTFGANGRGMAAALNQNYSVNSSGNPAPRGSIVMLYATGAAAQPVRVRIAGRDAAVHYAGQAPGLVEGVQQINVEIPWDCPPGVVPVAVRSGNTASLSTVYLAVQ
jgi:astacin